MSYAKQNFKPGDVLLASQLNAMDDQIALNEAASKDFITSAGEYAAAAATSAAAAETSAEAAEAAAGAASNSADAASDSEVAANNSATAAALSAQGAYASAAAADASETAAATSAQNAADSATAASSSATFAESSAAAARGSAQSAQSSELSAQDSKNKAKTSEVMANLASTNAETAKNGAVTAKEAAEAAKTAAESAQTAAAASQTSAANSATAAAASQTAAAASETSASNSAASASSSATSASGSATAAAASASAAAQSAQDAQDVLDSIPPDYTAMTEDVSGLKSGFNEYKSNTFIVALGKNLFNPETIEDHKYLNLNGTIEDYQPTAITDFIPVDPGKYVTYSNKTSSGRSAYSPNTMLFYDESKMPIPNSGASYVNNKIVPSGASYVRVTFGRTIEELQIELTDDGVFTTPYEAYHAPVYSLDPDIIIPAEQVQGISDEIEEETVKGFNLVPISDNGVGAYYASGSRIVYDESSTSLHYAIISVKQNTDYFVNFGARFWILTDDSDQIISSGQNFARFVINTGDATKLYYTVYNNQWDVGLIVSEGYHGTKNNVSKPKFIGGFNQLMNDSWFAVALTPSVIRFTNGIDEKLYYYNILALDANMIDVSIGTKEEDGVVISGLPTMTDSNAYGYTVYDNNLSVVANLPRGGKNRITVRPDNVGDCSVLIIGDSIVARNGGKIGQTMLDAFSERNKTLTLLGTLGTGNNRNEGRPGWTSSDYFTNKQYEGVTNPFYNPTSETFDFSYYMTNAGYSAVDFVVIHLGGNDLFGVDFANARAKIKETEDNIIAMIESVLAWNPNQKIIIQLCPTICPDTAKMNAVSGNAALIRAKFVNYNAEMLVKLGNYPNNVRCSNDYMIVDPINDMADHIHPNDTGLAKIGMELVSQINCWQADIT